MKVNVAALKRAYNPSRHGSGVVSMKNDKSYFMRRAAQERSAAERASGRAARDAHQEMEMRYRELVGTGMAQSPAAGPTGQKPAI